MKITDLRTFVVGNPKPGLGGRYFVFLKLITDDRIEGLGEVYASTFGPRTVQRMIEDVVERHVAGTDPFGIERLWRDVYGRGYTSRPDLSLMAVLSGIEMACWDIVGKAVEKPVYSLLGGRLHERLRTYTYLYARDGDATDVYTDPELAGRRALEYVKLGFTALKFDPAGPYATLDPRQPSLAALDRSEAYMRAVRDRVLEKLHQREADDRVLYYALYSVFHEDWHTEAFTYTRQTLGHPAPRLSGLPQRRPGAPRRAEDHEPWRGDVAVPGGVLLLGASPEEPFAFDNEKWAHPVEVRPFTIARAPVTQSEFAAFVDDGGYRRKDLWDDEGWAWREAAGADHPVYWQRDAGGGWLRRDFDETVPLEAHRPVVHVNWYEAQAYCRWAGRRLPTEAEWEAAAAAEREPSGERLSQRKRHFPWGSEPPTPHRANLDWQAMGCVGVAGLAGGDSGFGCRQMMGNVWEWTASPFLPYPGFEPDMYRDNSQPWFGTRRVLRGGSWATRSRLLRNTLRNFFTPERRDVVAGFRTCGVSG